MKNFKKGTFFLFLKKYFAFRLQNFMFDLKKLFLFKNIIFTFVKKFYFKKKS